MPACAREEPGMNVIEARGLTKVYGGRAVVSDFAMTVAAGDIYGFVGKNGAGKSTVMKMICGDVLPTAGEVVLFEGDRVSAGAAGAARAAGSAGDGEGVRRIGVLIEELALLNTIPESMGEGCSKIKYLSVAPMFAEAIERIYQEISIAKLFN